MEQKINQTDGVAEGLWRRSLLLTSLLILVLLGTYYETLLSMVSVWWRSETFAHGFFIFPISLYLIWEKRAEIARLSPSADARPLFLLGLSGLGWLLANVVDVQVVQQLGLIGMIPLIVWAILGWRVTRLIIFPLAFLFFAVPIGEFLVPPMMNFTADFTVAMIELTGIPVYREGTFFSIPSGDWSVVEGCSGLRYLIASITLGTLYAYMTYCSIYRRIAFVILAIIFPIIANGLRAYMIVMIAHYSDMKLALGVDHYIYGWVFFGIVMFFMFWIGSFWREETTTKSENKESQKSAQVSALKPKKQAVMALLVILLFAIWPAGSHLIVKNETAQGNRAMLATPAVANGWQLVERELTDWAPIYTGQQVERDVVYRNSDGSVGLYLRYYRDQKQGSELINSQNVLITQKHPVWKMLDQYSAEIKANGQPLTIKRSRLSSSNKKFLVWHWNWISGEYSANDYVAKLLEAKDKLLGEPADAAAIILIAEYDESEKRAQALLQKFVDALFPSIDKSLKEAAQS